MTSYPNVAFTSAVTEVQRLKGARRHDDLLAHAWPDFEALTPDEIGHITTRDSFYLATVGDTGWPYVQHRGGDAGLVTVIDPRTIGWIERTGNRQYIGIGNITAVDRVAAIFMDYPNRRRLKMYGHATYHANPSDELLDVLGVGSIRVDGAVTVAIAATSWNCAKYITPRYTAEDVGAATRPLRNRIADLERQLANASAASPE
jgi:uncharacterized protein